MILVTGGLGYIGSHIVVDLLKTSQVAIVDNLDNTDISRLATIEKLSGKRPLFYQKDIRANLDDIFSNDITAVIHCAGLKSVNESISDPLVYYQNNIVGTLNLLETMAKHSCYKLIFSSSCTVYGSNCSPAFETSQTGIGITNPYGKTKFMIEEILTDLSKSDNRWNITILRYFNPVGGLPGLYENPKKGFNNLMPYIIGVANGKFKELLIFGNDYDTRDGTCIRDYIHVVDLAEGHSKAISLEGFNVINLGTGQGTTVLEMVKTFESVNRITIPFKIVERRCGDLPVVYADTTKATAVLGWKPKYGLDEMVKMD